ncbi:hypothetical protein, partial [Clostridium perfringens]
ERAEDRDYRRQTADQPAPAVGRPHRHGDHKGHHQRVELRRHSNAGGAAAANGYVAAVNSAIGLRAPTAIPGTGTTGAFGVCSAL